MQRKQLDNIINDQLGSNEMLQPEVYELLMSMIPRVIQAGTIYKNDSRYRYGACEVNEPNAIKRVINNLSTTLKSNEGYKAGLVDTTRETLERQHEALSSQLNQILPSNIDAEKKDKLIVDIADVFLTSWLVVDSLPNESGWGSVWTQR